MQSLQKIGQTGEESVISISRMSSAPLYPLKVLRKRLRSSTRKRSYISKLLIILITGNCLKQPWALRYISHIIKPIHLSILFNNFYYIHRTLQTWSSSIVEDFITPKCDIMPIGFHSPVTCKTLNPRQSLTYCLCRFTYFTHFMKMGLTNAVLLWLASFHLENIFKANSFCSTS